MVARTNRGRFPRGARVVVVVLLVAAGCTASTSPPDLPAANDFVDTFLASWTERDFGAMTEAFTADALARWPEQRVRSLVGRQMGAGDITGYEVSRIEEIAQPSPGSSPSPGAEVSVETSYEIVYESAATPRAAALRGTMSVVFSGDDQRWGIEWDRSLLWPGIDGAHSFNVRRHWPERASILARDGRPLARGPAPNRRYPFGSVGGMLVGSIERVSRERAAVDDEVYAPGDFAGGSGLELGLEERLAGTPSSTLRVLDRAGDVVEIVGRSRKRPGDPVRTTIDIAVQQAVESALGGTLGGAVVLDPRDGDLLAAVGSGSFNPNNYVGAEGVDPFDRSIEGRYPPGSAMKVVTASAALDAGVMTPATRLTGPKEYRGVRNFESEEFTSLDFATALKYSVNTAFAQIAEKVGARRMSRYAEAFGFNSTPALPLGAAEPSFPYPSADYDLLWGSIGQARVLATPLEMATVAATIANDGVRMEPRVTRKTERSGTRVVARKTAAQMTAMMVGVVQGGTGFRANVSGLSVAGKTGTAEVDVDGKRKNHAWFIAFAPAESPRVALAVVSEFGGVGGEVAAPIARNILISVLPLVE